MIHSFANLCNTMSHSAVCEFDFSKDYPVWWNWWIKVMTRLMNQYFEILYKATVVDKKNPIHVVRFEDLCDDAP